ncbi:THUMP domain-containing class I SAM-dependent RNA methyltransferase [Geothermobacter hydrogeniphilus]|uniref:Uncharacterized protein n=1 Tax=Geothermobacter hydrogeniphilus TaxID=1969733 RepID=A0A1X0YB69_9BACT|nr:THUMP domain-containing protein [Geothermobacter hydrogeniphilus]ORJ62418.1 hypothetical protein B5V00_03800 [Geothermobacter hydrogeniphilus]
MKNRQVDLFAVVPPGFEQVCAAELLALGMADIGPEAGGVSFTGKLRELYLANLWLRSAGRVLVRFAEVQARDFPSLFRKAVRLPWGEFIRPGQRMRFRVSSRGSRLQHGGRIAETLEMAARQALGVRQEEDGGEEQLVLVRLEKDCCFISIDSSGALLHRRGYRVEPGAAPLRENLAAAILATLAWRSSEPMVDPFCGSGTFAIEAALLAANIPPGRQRGFAFMHWPGFRHGLWKLLLDEADRGLRKESHGLILAADRDAGMLTKARANAELAGVAGMIEWQCSEVIDLRLPTQPGVLVANPPYGDRLEQPENVARLYRQLDALCLTEWRDWRKGIIVPDPALLRQWSGRKKIRFRNGGLPVRLWFD